LHALSVLYKLNEVIDTTEKFSALLIPSHRGNELNIETLSFTKRQGFLFFRWEKIEGYRNDKSYFYKEGAT